MEISKYIEVLLPFLKKCRKLILDGQEAIVGHEKKDGSLVTEIDIKISDLFQKLIKQKFPGHHVLDEEKALQDKNLKQNINNSEYMWVIDPIDGTKAYFHGSSLFATAIALFKNKKPVFGLIYLPFTGQLIYNDNNNVYKIVNAFSKKESKKVIHFVESKLNSNSLIYFPVKCAKDHIKDYKYTFIDGYSSYIYTFDVFCNVAQGAFLKDNISMWDVYSSLPIAKTLGMKVYNINDGTELKELTLDYFNSDLKVKNIWLICHPKYKNELFSILKK